MKHSTAIDEYNLKVNLSLDSAKAGHSIKLLYSFTLNWLVIIQDTTIASITSMLKKIILFNSVSNNIPVYTYLYTM